MGEIPRLRLEGLDHLEALLVGQGAVVVQRLRPPVSAEALAAVEDYLDLMVPAELRMWWDWHDGTDVKMGERAAHGTIGPFFAPLSATQAIDVTGECRDGALEDAPHDPDFLWKANWLAVWSYGKVACDCAVGVDAPVPILSVDYHHVDVPGTVVARSFGEVIGWWIEALECGAWRYDTGRDVWERREDLVPPEREALV